MDDALSAQDWLAGARWTLADGALTPYVNRLAMLGLDTMWAGRPNLARWWDRVRQRASFGPALVEWLPDDLRRRMEQDARAAAPALAQALAATTDE